MVIGDDNIHGCSSRNMKTEKVSVDLYARKKRWKVVLSVIAVVIVILSMYYTNNLVKRFATQEQRQMSMWAVKNYMIIIKLVKLFHYL